MRTFDNLLLLGRPASGKSEFIDFMKNIPESKRADLYGLGAFDEVDDFPWIWEKFMEDDIWEKAGYARRYSFGGENPGMSVQGGPLFDFCMYKFNDDFQRRISANPGYLDTRTLMIEFARGGKEAYAKALSMLSDDVLKKAAILFIYVSYDESRRRNDARYQEKMKHSILAHKVPDETMSQFYSEHDWLTITNNAPSGYLMVRDIKVPFVTMNNEPELTDPVLLDQRYRPALTTLRELYHEGL